MTFMMMDGKTIRSLLSAGAPKTNDGNAGAIFVTMKWLMTVQETGNASPALGHTPAGVEFDLTPRWISPPDEPPPNLNHWERVHRCSRVVEIRRPDGTRISAELRLRTAHFNFPYELRNERDARGRIRNPWRHQVVLIGVSVGEVPPGSEIWGEVPDEDSEAPSA
jgi:hypothetical protein